MNALSRWLLVPVFVFAGTAEFTNAADSWEPSPESVKETLRRRSYPWYDAKADAYRPLIPSKTSNAVPSPPRTEVPLAFPMSQVVMWSILVVFLATILFFIYRHFDGFEIAIENNPADVHTRLSVEALEALPEPTRGVNDLLGEAERLASLSQFESAIAFYYGWQLVQLDRRRFIELAKGKTNRQYGRELARSQPVLNGIFSDSTRLFEDAFFGGLPVSREDYFRVWEFRKQLEAPAEVKRR